MVSASNNQHRSIWASGKDRARVCELAHIGSS